MNLMNLNFQYFFDAYPPIIKSSTYWVMFVVSLTLIVVAIFIKYFVVKKPIQIFKKLDKYSKELFLKFYSIFITFEKPGSITAIATDSRRLSMITREINNEAFIGEGIIIPLKTINEVYKLLTGSGVCKISFDSKQCHFKINETEVISRIVEGQFPNYRQIIPKEYSHKSVIETA